VKRVHQVSFAIERYLSGTYDTGSVSGWDFAKHVITKNKKTSTRTPFTFDVPF